MKNKYAWKEKDNPNWKYWVVEYYNLIAGMWIHERFCPIGKPLVIKDSFCRTAPVTEEFYFLFKGENDE